jgi:hypothetical protein
MPKKGVGRCECGHGRYLVLTRTESGISTVECCACGARRKTRSKSATLYGYNGHCPPGCERHEPRNYPDAQKTESSAKDPQG